MKRSLKILWLLVVFFTISSQNMKSADICKVYFEINSALDYCGDDSEREIIISVNIGEVTSADSLYGYNFQIKYDTNLIKFTDMLYYGTLSENCYYKQGSATPGGYFKVAAINIDNMLIGNKPLAAIKGTIKAKCSIDTEIQMNYIDFTKEFTRDSIELNDIGFVIDKVDKEDRTLKLKFRKDSLDLKLDKKIDLYIEKQYSEMNEIMLEFSGNIDLLDFDKIIPKNSDYQIELIEIKSDTAKIKVKSSSIIYFGNLVSIDTKSIGDTNINAQISVYAKIDTCECVFKIIPAIAKLYKYQDSIVNKCNEIDYSKNTIYYLDGGVLDINKVFNNIKIFDSLGVLRFESDNIIDSKIVVSNINTAGIYYGVLQGKEINRIIIIKN